MNNIGVVQSGNEYFLYLPTNILVGHLVFPPDQQYMLDAKSLDYITKTVAVRWGVYSGQKKGQKG